MYDFLIRKIRIFINFTIFLFSILLYYLYFPFYFIGLKRVSDYLLESASRVCLLSMRVEVNIITRTYKDLYPRRKEIHIANHYSPLDVLITQGFFKMPCLTTSHTHLSKILIGIKFVITKYGHYPLDYKNNNSRILALQNIRRTLCNSRKIFYYPSGSLITPITDRFSKSVCFLSKESNAYIIAWYFDYHDSEDVNEAKIRYDPLKIIISRIRGKKLTINCIEHKIYDPKEYSNPEEMRDDIMKLYKNI